MNAGLADAVAAYTEFMEIEQRELAEARVNAAREEGERLSRMKDEFLATVSHELRTPLQSILGWARLVRSGHVSAEQVGKALETIERNAVVQSQLIEDILDVSRIITGKARIDPQIVDVAVVRAPNWSVCVFSWSTISATLASSSRTSSKSTAPKSASPRAAKPRFVS